MSFKHNASYSKPSSLELVSPSNIHTGGSRLMRISLLQFFKKFYKFTLCVVLIQRGTVFSDMDAGHLTLFGVFRFFPLVPPMKQ
jgi:hypothetical protein